MVICSPPNPLTPGRSGRSRLGISTLTGDAFTGADTNSDNVVDGRDLANVNLHLLGQKMITEVVAK